jgi:hypothetical protein
MVMLCWVAMFAMFAYSRLIVETVTARRREEKPYRIVSSETEMDATQYTIAEPPCSITLCISFIGIYGSSCFSCGF